MMTGLLPLFSSGSTVPVEPAGDDYNTFGFDGSSKLINCGQDSSIVITNNITVACWVNINSTSNTVQNIFGRWRGAATSWSWMLTTESNSTLSFYTYGGSSPQGLQGPTLTVGDWYFLCGRLSGTDKRFTVNSTNYSTTTPTTGIFGGTEDLCIGTANDAVEPSPDAFMLDGSITSPMMWNRFLSDAEVSSLYQAGKIPYYETLPSSLTSGCVLALELSSRDNTLNDLSGNGNNGTANGGVTDDGELQTFTSYS